MDKKRYRHIRRILTGVLILNWSVALAKILYGLLSNCASISADGFHSLSDGTSNIIALIGISIASVPSDKDHPYGHKKYETFFSLCIGAILFIICFSLLKEGVARIFNPVIPRIDIKSFLIMLLTLCINVAVMNYEYRKGVILQSDILISDSMHTRADIFTSLSVIIALIAIKLGYAIIDAVATIIIGLFIAYTGYVIVKRGQAVLCDTAPIMDVKKIADVVLKIKGVAACHKIRTRGRPDDIHVDLHIQVNPDMHIDEAHKISYTVESELKRNIPAITDVVVHMEPKEKKDKG